MKKVYLWATAKQPTPQQASRMCSGEFVDLAELNPMLMDTMATAKTELHEPWIANDLFDTAEVLSADYIVNPEGHSKLQNQYNSLMAKTNVDILTI